MEILVPEASPLIGPAGTVEELVDESVWLLGMFADGFVEPGGDPPAASGFGSWPCSVEEAEAVDTSSVEAATALVLPPTMAVPDAGESIDTDPAKPVSTVESPDGFGTAVLNDPPAIRDLVDEEIPELETPGTKPATSAPAGRTLSEAAEDEGAALVISVAVTGEEISPPVEVPLALANTAMTIGEAFVDVAGIVVPAETSVLGTTAVDS